MKAGKATNHIWLVLLVIAALIVMFRVIVPALMRRPRGHPPNQHAQLYSIKAALGLFNNAFDGYPASGAADPNGAAYCGAMKLCEGLMGQDMLGFHSDSIFRADGRDAAGSMDLYDQTGDWWTSRKGPFLPPESADAVEIREIWSDANGTGAFLATSRVLCDVWRRRLDSGKKVGMPVLYYRADVSKKAHDAENPDNPENIYDYRDNHALLALGVPGEAGKQHPLYADPKMFYEMTRDKKVKDKSVPHNADSFILISAGYDGVYGTEDDITNFERK